MATAAQEHRFAMFRRVIAILLGRFGVNLAKAAPASTAVAVTTDGTTGPVGASGTTASSDTNPTGTGTTAGSTTTIPAVNVAALAAPTTMLEETLARAEQHAHDQLTSKEQAGTETRDVPVARKELFLQLRSVAGTAKTLKTQVPGIGVLKLPTAKTRAASLVTAAEAFAENAGVYQQVLIENGQAADFLDRLNTAIVTYKNAVAARGTSMLKQRGATAGIKAEVALGTRIVQQLNATLQPMLSNSPADLAAWNSARRVTRVAATAATSSDSSSATTGTTPTAAPTPTVAAKAAGSDPVKGT